MKILRATTSVIAGLILSAFGFALSASGQAGSVIPIPFVTTFAGIAAGSGNTVCSNTTDIPNIGGAHIGDGCLPTQAILGGLFDVVPDPAGNVLISENGANAPNTLQDIRVVYNGGAAFTALLRAANPTLQNTVLQQGHIYTLAGGLLGAITAKNTILYCGNVIGNPQAIDKEGNGCPAAQSYIRPRGMAIDPYGDVYFVNNASLFNNLRVIYNGGPNVKSLLSLLYPTLVPQIGYVYELGISAVAGYTPDGQLVTKTTFFTVRYVALDNAGNIYVSDGAPNVSTVVDPTNSAAKITVNLSAASVRKIDINTGIVTTVAGENNCATAGPYFPLTTYGCQYGPPVEGAPAVTNAPPGASGSATPFAVGTFNAPYAIFFDQNNNLFIADSTNARVRVVYAGGTLPGITNPVVGSAYTYAGGGTLTVDGTAAKSAKFSSVQSIGMDRAGNLYVADGGSTHPLWRFDARTGIGNIIGITKTQTAGAFCSGGSSGPVALDTIGDGCPAVQATFINNIGNISFDNQGNFYLADATSNLIRKYSYNNIFPATPDGTAVTQPLAFKSTVASTLTGQTFTVQGRATTEYSDTGGDTCSLAGALAAGAVCVYNVSFNPAHDGTRPGTLQFLTSAGAAVSELVSGVGIASDIAIDTGTQSTLGTGITPSGVGTDLAGNVYVSDTKGNQVLVGASSGATLTPFITGLSKPAQIAVDNAGNVYVADSGNNRVVEVTSTGTVIGPLGTGLSAPAGVAVDAYGNVYVSDTGNNRIVTVAQNGNQVTVPIFGLKSPTELTFDNQGNLYVVDSGNARLVEYASGNAAPVTLDSGVVPAGVAVDNSGTVYVTDSASQQLIAYPAGAVSGNVLLTGLGTPGQLASDADANLFFADAKSTGATQLRRSLGSFQFPITNIGQPTTVSVSVNNVGNAALTFPTTPPATTTGSPYISIAPAVNNGCTVGSSTAVGAACGFIATFAPTTTGPASATAKFASNAANNATTSALLTGTGYRLVSTNTTLTLTSPTGGVFFAQTVVVTATLAPSTTTVTPTGTFSISIDGKTPTKQPYGTGTFSLSIPNLVVGVHTVSVSYSGDTVYASSASALTITVNKAQTTTLLTVTPLSTGGSLSLVLSANVSSTTASGITGTITFYAGTQQLGQPQTVDASGSASIKLTALSFTDNHVTAVYSGAANFAPSTSAIATGTGDFAIGTASPNIAVPQGGIVSASFQVSSLLGATGDINLSCKNLPANSVCRFQPVVVNLGTTQLTVGLQVYTNVNVNAGNENLRMKEVDTFFALLFPAGTLMLALRRRRKLSGLFAIMLAAVIGASLSGCGSGSTTSSSSYITPPGTYNIVVVFAGANGLTATHTVPVVMTVIQNSGQ